MAEGASDKATAKQRAEIADAVQLLTNLVSEAEDVHYMRMLIVLADKKVRFEITKQFENKPVKSGRG